MPLSSFDASLVPHQTGDIDGDPMARSRHWLGMLNSAVVNNDAPRVQSLIEAHQKDPSLGSVNTAWKGLPGMPANDPGPALHVAIQHDHTDIVELLCATPGIDANVLNEYGFAPLRRTMMNVSFARDGRTAAVRQTKALLDAGAEPHRSVEDSSPMGAFKTPLHIAVFHSTVATPLLLDLFHERGLLNDALKVDFLFTAVKGSSEQQHAVGWLLDHGVLDHVQDLVALLAQAEPLRACSLAMFARLEHEVMQRDTYVGPIVQVPRTRSRL